MREDDRVAIHEAMEQQTISIAKVNGSATAMQVVKNPSWHHFNCASRQGVKLCYPLYLRLGLPQPSTHAAQCWLLLTLYLVAGMTQREKR